MYKKCFINTIFYPKNADSNKHIKIISDGIIALGYGLYSFSDILKKPRLITSIKLANFNWFDNISSRNHVIAFFSFLLRFFTIEILRIMGIKIIYTVHNKIPHDKKYLKLNALFMRYLLKRSDRIVIMCTETKNLIQKYLSENEMGVKIRFIPLPTYTGIYKEKLLHIKELPNNHKMHILFLGMVRKYKNIELILRLARDLSNMDIEFVIAGNAMEDYYKHEIQEKVKNLHSVTLILRFIKDDELYSFYKWSDVAIIPLSTESSLNSGSALLAFSMERTAIVPQIGTIKDMQDCMENIFVYSYNSNSEHYESLKEKVVYAYEIWRNDSLMLKRMGCNVKRYVDSKYSKEKIMDMYSNLYSEFI